MLMSDIAPPVDNQPRRTWDIALDLIARVFASHGIYLDLMSGANDDEKLDAAIALQQSIAGMPPIILPPRTINVNKTRSLYSGVKLVGNGGVPSGQKNPELSGGNLGGTRVVLGSAISSGTSSWWVNTGGSQVYDAYFGHFMIQGDAGTSKHQAFDCASGTMYACCFDSLSGNFLKGMFGTSGRKFLVTQVSFPGNWTLNNCWDTPIFLGGSDVLVNPDMMNIGVSASASQTGSLGRYFIILDSLEADLTGKVYVSTMNGWRGLLISGNSNINMIGGIYEGFKPTGTTLSGPGPGSQVKITGGAVNLYGTKIGQGMDNPDSTEKGLLDISGGEVNLWGVEFYGNNLDTVNAITHTGGRLYAAGITKRTNSTWTNRPKVATTATVGTGTYTFCCPDQSVA